MFTFWSIKLCTLNLQMSIPSHAITNLTSYIESNARIILEYPRLP
jgi:hypothetical protein